jgi:hypothetical protein
MIIVRAGGSVRRDSELAEKAVEIVRAVILDGDMPLLL